MDLDHELDHEPAPKQPRARKVSNVQALRATSHYR